MTGQPLGRTHQPLRQAVTDAMREAIVAGTYRPGERLYEDRLAQELGVSRNPVRESLQALAAESFVVLEPRRGARVAAIDRDRDRELFEVRGALEGLAAFLAAERRTDDELGALTDVVDDGCRAIERGKLDDLPMLNTRFHDLMNVAADNDMLVEVLGQLAGVIQWVCAKRLPERVGDSWAEHRSIVEAIADHDPERARRLAEAHVTAARSAFLAG